jgi:hypothetical protein
MTELAPIEHLTIDETTYRVADLPTEVQAAVKKYEEWRERYVLAQDEVQLVSAALRDLGSQLVAAVRATEQRAAVEAKVNVEVPGPSEQDSAPSPVVPGDTLVVEDAAK